MTHKDSKIAKNLSTHKRYNIPNEQMNYTREKCIRDLIKNKAVLPRWVTKEDIEKFS